jgi:predicted membrane chloride channel (bestrophin family)
MSFLPQLVLPLTPFTLLSPSLGLLLVFRTNSSYGRWDEARKMWGLNINHTRDLNRMATAWYGHDNQIIDPAKRAEDLRQVSLYTWAFVRSMKRHLSPPSEDEEAFVEELYARMAPEQAEAIISAAHRPNRALYDLSVVIDKLPMHFMRKNEINKNLSIFEDTLGGCERLLSSPVPLFYTRHTARFLSTWLLLLPLAMYQPFSGSWNHVAMIPATALTSVFLFGIDELSTQLEEPFTILPMQGFCDKIGGWCDEIVSWRGQGLDKEEQQYY